MSRSSTVTDDASARWRRPYATFSPAHMVWWAAIAVGAALVAWLVPVSIAADAVPVAVALVLVVLLYELLMVSLLRSGAWVSTDGVSVRGVVRRRFIRWDDVAEASVEPGAARVGSPVGRLVIMTQDGGRVVVPTFGRYSPPLSSSGRLERIAADITASRPAPPASPAAGP